MHKLGKVLRRRGTNLWGRPNAPVNTRRNKPGGHGTKQARSSEYGLKLNEKQKLRTYFLMREKPFKRLFAVASKYAANGRDGEKGNTGNHFLKILESRLHTFVYRMGWASMTGARQLISHKHVIVNGRAVNKKSHTLKEGDVVTLSETAKNMKVVLENIEKYSSKLPGYINSTDKFTGSLIRAPQPNEIVFEGHINPQAVVEYYTA